MKTLGGLDFQAKAEGFRVGCSRCAVSELKAGGSWIELLAQGTAVSDAWAVWGYA